MAITIVATVGDANANSYASEAEFIAWAAARLNVPADTTVGGESISEDEEKALIEAQREMQTLPWKGQRVSATQALAWPRSLVPDPDSPIGALFSVGVVPSRVKEAQIELALEFLKAGSTDLAVVDASLQVTSETFGPVSFEYADPSDRAQGFARFPRFSSRVSPLLLDTVGSGQVRVVR